MRRCGSSLSFHNPAKLDDIERERLRVARGGVTDGAGQGERRTGYLQLGGTNPIDRAYLVGFMLDLAANGCYVREAPMVSY